MLTYVLVAILTTVVSVTTAYLDEALRAESAFLPKRLNTCLSKNQNVAHIRRCRFWRNVLERLVLALADQQLVTGFAILITGWIVYHQDIFGAHFTLVIYLSSLSSSSHLAAIITLRKYFDANPTLALLRIVLITAFALVLAASIAVSHAFRPFYSLLLILVYGSVDDPTLSKTVAILLSTWPILWAFWTGIWQIVPESRDRFKAWVEMKSRRPIHAIGRCVRYPLSFVRCRLSWKGEKNLRRYARATLHYMVFLSPGTVFVLQILFAAISVAMALLQKFAPGDPDYDQCSMDSPDENQMGYGQILAFLMLTLPAIAAVEAYKGEQYLPETHVNTTEADI